MVLIWLHPEATMPVNFSIKNVPDEIAEALRDRAARNHRSLQGELMAILEETVGQTRTLTPREVLEEVRRLGVKTPSDSVDIIRRLRDSR